MTQSIFELHLSGNQWLRPKAPALVHLTDKELKAEAIRKAKAKVIREATMLAEFQAWLTDKGYTPKHTPIPHPSGVTIGADGLTCPRFSDDHEGLSRHAAYRTAQAQAVENAAY